MFKVIVIGAGFSGSAAALMLAADVHEVRVVDRDTGPVPARTGRGVGSGIGQASASTASITACCDVATS